jgi:hypothetical protein
LNKALTEAHGFMILEIDLVFRRWMANAIGPARAFVVAYSNFFP